MLWGMHILDILFYYQAIFFQLCLPCSIVDDAIFPSVYQGVKSFYKEEDETIPVNVYGKSKVAAEQFIYEKWPNFAILRSSIIFGPQTISPVPKSLPIQVCCRR